MTYEVAKPRLAAAGRDLGEGFWNAVRANLGKFDEAKEWAAVVAGPVTPLIDDPAFTSAAADLLPESLDETSWSAWTGAIKEVTGAKGKALFLPLRRALTGKDHGPEMGALLPLIGRDKVLARLRGDAA
jgi:glutamyl-tRNA synthetase